MSEQPQKQNSLKTSTFGTCKLVSLSPKKEALSPETKSLNVVLSFDEAPKLNLAIDECVRKLNRYKRSTVEGKRAGLNFTIHFDLNRISMQ